MPKRMVDTDFWRDSKVLDDFTPEDKLFFLYLITGPATNMAGCYEIPLAEASFLTGLTRETVMKLLNRMEAYHNVIRYDEQTHEVLVLNWERYNWSSSGLVKKNIEKNLDSIKNEEFRAYVRDKLQGKKFTEPKKREEASEPVYPTMEEVTEYCNDMHYQMDSGSFWFYYNHYGWKDTSGKPIKDWRKFLDKCEKNGSFGKEVI